MNIPIDESKQSVGVLQTPVFQVITTWLWVVLLPLGIVGVLVGVLKLNLTDVRHWWSENTYFQGYFEAVVAGLLPMLFVRINKDAPSRYGFSLKNLWKSILLSLIVAAIFHIRSFVMTGEWLSHSSITAPLPLEQRLLHGIWGILANGPLEVFFYAWLVTKTDFILKSEDALISKGFLLTTVLFGLLHIITTQDVVNALNVLAIFFFLGLIYKYTKNSIGPMVGWTLINGMVLAYLEWMIG